MNQAETSIFEGTALVTLGKMVKSLSLDQFDYPLDWPKGPDGSPVLRVHQTTDKEMKVHVRRSKDILKEIHGEHRDEQKEGRNRASSPEKISRGPLQCMQQPD